MLVAGIDPGATGGWATFDTATNRLIAAGRINRDNMPALHRVLNPCQIILIERAQASPNMGHSSAFEYGRTFGRIEAACQMTTADILYVGAVVWKAWLHIPADKAEAVRIAFDKFPNLKSFMSPHEDGVAEAALIGSVLLQEKLKAQIIRNNQAAAKPKRKRVSYSV